MSSHLRPLAALLPLCFIASAPAQTEEDRLDPIVVTATRQPMRVSETLADVTVISREEIEKSGQETIIDLLARQPGIQISSYGGPGTATSLYMRGANSNQSKILVDGISINSTDGSGAPLRFLPLADVERIEILRGPASMLYGADALGGVINVITRRGQSGGLRVDGFVGYGSHNTQQASAGLSGGNEHWRFRVEANHFQTDGISAQRHAVNKDADDDAYRNTGGAVSLSFLPKEGHEIGVSYRNNKGVGHYDGGNTPPDGEYDNRNTFDITQWQVFSKNRFLENWTSTLQYGESEDYQKNYSWNAWGFPPAEDISSTHSKNRQISWQNDIELSLGHALFMAEQSKQRVYPHGADYQKTPEIRNTSLLAGWTANAGKHRWQLNVRRDNHSEFDGKTTYGAAYGYQLTDALRARVSHGTAFRAPNVYELFMRNPSWWFQGNPDLKPEESRNSEIGLTWEQGGHLASATYYHNRVKNLISGTGTDPVTGFTTYENINKALLEGVTLAYQGSFGAWHLAATYDWLNAENKSKTADGVGYERLGRRARNKATLALTHSWGDLETGVEVVGVGRRYDGSYRKDATQKEELGGYGLTNLTARYALTRELSLEGRINNVFDKKYETARGYGTDGLNAFVGLRYSPR
ncbi:MAG: TonB-dependent receptor [Zoogloeaceae bacterium]|nr:TonB-dependent receptor [Zoogloeaceae bacterium]